MSTDDDERLDESKPPSEDSRSSSSPDPFSEEEVRRAFESDDEYQAFINRSTRQEADSRNSTSSLVGMGHLPVFPSETSKDIPGLEIRELVVLVASIILCDFTIYSGGGFSAYALLFGLAPALLYLGAPARQFSGSSLVLIVLFALLIVRLVWQGSVLGVALGFALVGAASMSLVGLRPFPLESALYTLHSVISGVWGLFFYVTNCPRGKLRDFNQAVGILVPVVLLFVFGSIFILANPILGDYVGDLWKWFKDAIISWRLTHWRIMFWIAAAWAIAGLLRPAVDIRLTRFVVEAPEQDEPSDSTHAPPYVYLVARNSLFAVVGLFALYLVFEILYIWLREIPEGFYYSGYAHKGAWWLTIALAFSTFTLGFIFRGALLLHPKVHLLKNLTWIWSIENFLLASSVFHRIYIYVEYNGMSRMRMVALYGISAVVIGFVLVVWKVLKAKTLVWLVRRDLTALFLVIFVFFLTPVDRIVTRYNVRQIMNGNPSPSVQIHVHPISPEGLPQLLPLLDIDNERVREGVKALLADRFEEIASRRIEIQTERWRHYQIAVERTHRILENRKSEWRMYKDAQQRKAEWDRFAEYAMSWYH